MKRLSKVFTGVGVALMMALASHSATGYWWGPGYGGPGLLGAGGPYSAYGGGWGPNLWRRHTYVYDPAYRWGPPRGRSYIRDLYLYGPGYAGWKRRYRHWW